MSTRSYHSSLRQEQAHQTRLRIRSAARQLFTRQGFSDTTIKAIAEAAGVSAATVYAAYDSKAGIVSAMLDDLEEGVDMGERLQRLYRETDAHQQLRIYLNAHCALYAQGVDVLRTALQALDTPEVAQLNDRGNQQRREVIDALTTQWHERDALRTGLDAADAADRIWLLTIPESFLTAVDRLGWTPARYEAWLGDLIATDILAPDARHAS